MEWDIKTEVNCKKKTVEFWNTSKKFHNKWVSPTSIRRTIYQKNKDVPIFSRRKEKSTRKRNGFITNLSNHFFYK
jgi:hypothetical protein